MSLLAEFKALTRLAGPLIASQLAQTLMVLTDTVMMARISPSALAGGALGGACYAFVSIFCIGVIAAVGTLVAVRQGAGDTAGAARLAQAGVWLAWLLSATAILVLWNLGPLLEHLGQSPANIAAAQQLLTFMPLALPGVLSFMALRGFISALGRPGPVMVISVAGTLLNYLGNDWLIEGRFGLPQPGLLGIGLVTALVGTGMAVALALYVRYEPAFAGYPLLKGLGRPDWRSLAELWRLGLPIGGTYAAESGLFGFTALCIGSLGSAELGAHQLASQIVAVAFMVPAGLGYATTLRVGHHFGAGDMLAARQAGRLALGFGSVLMGGFALVFWLIPEAVVDLFLDRTDPAFTAVYAMTLKLLAIAAWFELFDGAQVVAMGANRGLTAARTTFIVGLCGYWLVGAPAAWILAFHFQLGAEGVWWGLAGGLAATAVGLAAAFEWRTRGLVSVAAGQKAVQTLRPVQQGNQLVER